MKKLLLVTISVGVFLLVTITAAIVIMTTRIQSQETGFSSSIPFSQGRVQPASDIMSNLPEQPAIINNPLVNVNTNNEIPETATPADRNTGDSLTVQIRPPTTAAVPNNPVSSQTPAARQPTPTASGTTTAPVASPGSTANSTSSASSASNVNRNTTQAPTTAPTASSANAPGPAAATQNTANTTAAGSASSQSTGSLNTTAATSAARTINDYWIQIGAYSGIVRAEDTREYLATQGLVSIIENREIGGQNLYRVRLGPYTSEREANHWLAIIKGIDGFRDSELPQNQRPYIHQTIRQL